MLLCYEIFYVDISCFTGENGISTYQKEMVTALAARKEALEMKLKEKIEELRQLCFREAVSQCLSLYLRYYLLSFSMANIGENAVGCIYCTCSIAAIYTSYIHVRTGKI